MASFDVVSLLTKIAVDLALDIIHHGLELWTDRSSHTGAQSTTSAKQCRRHLKNLRGAKN